MLKRVFRKKQVKLIQIKGWFVFTNEIKKGESNTAKKFILVYLHQ